MKTSFPRFVIAILVALNGLVFSARAVVTFTCSPAVVSNTYPGFVSLQIGGLTNGETVVVQKFIDLNTNGFLDGQDLLVQQFKLTDGVNALIGGVTNINVPGDVNSTAGAITASLSFRNGDFMQNLIARYLYVVSSPGGHFTPLTNSFTVTNFPFGQSISGNIVSNSTSTTLSNALVIVFPGPRPGHNGLGQPLGGTLANNAGQYSISLPAGTYMPIPFDSNYVANAQSAPLLTLSNGVSIVTNLSLLPATTTLSGSVVDATNAAIKLPGILLPCQSTNYLIAVAISDTNGNFTARVTTNQWNVGSDDTGLIIHGYVGNNNGVDVAAPATGVAVSFAQANVLFYGTVTNGSGTPVLHLDLNASDMNNLYSMDGYTDANGNYAVGAVATGSGDPWSIGVAGDSPGLSTNTLISQPLFQQSGGTNLTASQAVLVNFTLLPAANVISGTLKDSGNNAITNVQVYAFGTIGGQNYQPSVNTDAGGNYFLNVTNGTWYVNVYCGGGDNSLPTNYLCPNTAVVTINNNNATTNFVAQLCNGVTINTAATLPVGEVNVSYDQMLSASTCAAPTTWTNLSGSAALPPGLILASNGELFGTPPTNGTYLFTVRVTDANSATASRAFSVTIYGAVQVTTTNLPDGTNGAAYSQSLQATGGQIFGGASAYSWSLTPGNNLPANLSLATNGLISGTVATSGTFGFSVRATDRVGGYADQALSLVLHSTNAPPAVGLVPASGQMLLYYPTSGSNYVLQTSTNVNGPWVTATNGTPVISILFTNSAPAQFFRLH